MPFLSMQSIANVKTLKNRQFNIEVQFVKSVNYTFEQSL